ncbi:MAG: fused MFS/spermidine synthase, partial [Coriobacteriia bacterium]|nr:fused MFS/spermidine synthase [Coriobacteriia bacterium]
LIAASLVLGSYVLVRVAPPDDRNAFGETVLFQADTQYHRVTVTEDASTRHLRFDRSHQSAIDLADGYTSRILYPDYMHLALALKPDAKRVLVLGLGGGAITKRYWHDYPGVSVDSVEIDPVVVDVAERYFGLPSDERLRTFTADARRFVQTNEETYDIVLIDAYYADALPFHLTTQQFFEEVERRMSADGVVAYNVISAVEGDKSKLFRSMYRTAGSVFEHLWVFPIGLGAEGDAQKTRNIIVIATDADISEETLRERVNRRVDQRVTIDGFDEFAEDLYTQVVPVGDVPLLTDDYAPTDSLIELY